MKSLSTVNALTNSTKAITNCSGHSFERIPKTNNTNTTAMNSKLIEVRLRGPSCGPSIYHTDHDSDEEATHMVTNFKQVVRVVSPSIPTFADDLNDVWSEMMQDFALDGRHDEAYSTTTQKITVPVVESTPKANGVPPLVLSDEEWMAMNQDFACDASHDMEYVEQVATPRRSLRSSSQEPYGDYGVWWEES